MVYISTSCIKTSSIKEAIELLVRYGFTNIELSGGTDYYDGLIQDIFELKERYGLNYLLHNYFPPAKDHHVLNLASLDNKVYEKTIEHLLYAIDLSKKLGANKFGFHAGFYLDVKSIEIGKKIACKRLAKKEKALERFSEGYVLLSNEAGKNLELYIENCVLSSTNRKTFHHSNPFMLTTYEDYKELKQYIDFKLLLDLAHLKVSSQSLSLDFDSEFDNMFGLSDYYHISENDALEDLNQGINQQSGIWLKLKQFDLKDKTLTLEINDGLRELIKSFHIVTGELR